MANQYGKTPAELVGVTDVLDALCINRAALYAGLNTPDDPKQLM